MAKLPNGVYIETLPKISTANVIDDKRTDRRIYDDIANVNVNAKK